MRTERDTAARHAPATERRAPVGLRTNRLREPLGVDGTEVEFSWLSSAEDTYVEVRLWPEGTTAEPWILPASVSGTAPAMRLPREVVLEARTPYRWQVRTVGDGSPWSEEARFETGVAADDWIGAWVGGPADAGKKTLYFRTVIDVPRDVVQARASVTALGWYRLYVNETNVTGHALVPRWTPFHAEIEYQRYDITEMLRPGRNVIGIVVAEGRFRGSLGFTNETNQYGDDLGCIADVEMTFADGSVHRFGTSADWSVGTGPILFSDPMRGERVDARIDSAAWLRADGVLPGGRSARVLPRPSARVVAEAVERVRDTARLAGKILPRASTTQLVDFGQNFSGVARVRLAGRAGSRVTLRYSEVLTPEGTLDTRYLSAKKGEWFQTDVVTLGDEPLDYIPAFTTHGFRYLEVEGLEHPLTAADVEGIVISTELDELSSFHASDPRLEQLWRNAQWALRSNFTDTATDCPTRERSGWTGDIQIFGPTASQLVDADAYLRRYLHNLAIEQGPDGTIPPVIPSEYVPGVTKRPYDYARTSAGWGDVAVMLPWTLYQYYGDRDVLRTSYPAARRWVDSLVRRATRTTPWGRRGRRGAGDLDRFVVDSGFHWGEWLRPGSTIVGEVIGIVGDSRADVATAYLANSARLLAQTADVLGEAGDAEYYRTVADNVRRAWRRAFVRQDGARVSRDRQDDYVRALFFDLLPEEQRPAAFRRLVELIERAGIHLQTGFLSTPLLMETLVQNGRPDLAYALLTQTTMPSWLGQLELGATTTWETWEGYRKNGRAHESHNHYAYGSVVQFLHERIAGLAPVEPGYRRMRVAPVFGEGLTSAGVRIRTPFGTASCDWKRDGASVEITVTVPAGCVLVFDIPGLAEEVGGGTHVRTVAVPARHAR